MFVSRRRACRIHFSPCLERFIRFESWIYQGFQAGLVVCRSGRGFRKCQRLKYPNYQSKPPTKGYQG